jgi:hypothetical protein
MQGTSYTSSTCTVQVQVVPFCRGLVLRLHVLYSAYVPLDLLVVCKQTKKNSIQLRTEWNENTRSSSKCKSMSILEAAIFCLAQNLPLLPRHTPYREVT